MCRFVYVRVCVCMFVYDVVCLRMVVYVCVCLRVFACVACVGGWSCVVAYGRVCLIRRVHD